MGTLIILFLFTLVFLAIKYTNSKPTLCDTCKHLKQKGSKTWKYTCNPGINRYSDDRFDKAPTYCKYYCKRDDEK